MKQFVTILSISICGLSLLSCGKENTELATDWSDEGMWCDRPADCKSAVDVFYIVSTMITKSTYPDGSESFMALLTEEEKQTLASEIDHVHKNIIPESVNFFAPYYHQMTMSSYQQLTTEQLQVNADKAKKEVCDAFDYYMANCNNGRPFMLVGYSQGSIMVKTLVPHLTGEQYKRMIAGYMMGFGLNENDLKGTYMKAATGRTDTGSIISWSSVKNVEAIYEGIWRNAVTCMNPVSWTPDDTTHVKYTFDGEGLTLHVDTASHVLIVEGLNPDTHNLPRYDTPWGKDNYHDYETYLYCQSIRQNMLDRIAAFGK